ncbi:hypothetical protein AGMMS50276_14230 [Synergistales bacterium]|nr:hypothetical protein AGMMS50276_14230 [Synergistales bacterium]
MNSTMNERSNAATVTTRVPLRLKQRWQQAAVARGITLTDFLITAANKATSEVFDEEDRIELSLEDRTLLAEMLVRPPQIRSGALHAAIQKRLAHMKNA